jgi:hypothetical protein
MYICLFIWRKRLQLWQTLISYGDSGFAGLGLFRPWNDSLKVDKNLKFSDQWCRQFSNEGPSFRRRR